MKTMPFMALICAFIIVFSVPCSNAATYTASISGLDKIEGIHGFTFWFEVSDDFSFQNVVLGDAIPPAISMGWLADNPQVDDTQCKLFKFGASDWDYTWAGIPNPLKNGTLFSFEYDGSILDFKLIQFANIKAENLYKNKIILESADANGAYFAAVPIPATAILFLSGIFGLVGIRRFKGGQRES